VLSRLQPLLLRKSLRAIVGQVEPRFRIDDVFTKRRIVLVSLAKGLIGPESAALLGSLFMAELWQAVLERAAVQPERRHPMVIYADEFQDYVHLPTDMADALAQARGLGVGLTLAHQHLAQLPTGLRAAVLANARSRVCFQMAADDAQAMARLSFGTLTPEDFQRLRRYQAYVQLVADGEMTGFASIRTLPMPEPISDPAVLRGLSRSRYGRRMIEGDPEQGEPVGRRRRSEL
jgi:type IV secretory pathway TraG/TraD family ATPase VirD4